MNEPKLGREIGRLLDHGLDDINPSTLQRLQAARKAALANYRTAGPAAAAGGASAPRGHGWHPNVRMLLPLAALLLALTGILYWQEVQQHDENEIDIMLLADDLPINAYLDKEFDAWLDHS